MTMRIFLLVSAVAQLVSPAFVPLPHQPESKNVTDLKMMFDLVKNCSASLTADFFVDDVTHLAEGNNSCGDAFFCKVHSILHGNFCEKPYQQRLVRTLKGYIKDRNVQCDNVTSTYTRIKMSRTLDTVKGCVQRRLFRGN